MRVGVGNIPGVDSVRVSLNEGYVDVVFGAASSATVQAIRAAIRSKGFSPKDAVVEITGRLVAREGAIVLIVPGTDMVFAVTPDPAAMSAAALRDRVGQTVLISGRIPEGRDSGRSAGLEASSVSAVPPGGTDPSP